MLQLVRLKLSMKAYLIRTRSGIVVDTVAWAPKIWSRQTYALSIALP